jgi:tetratricopeptide (TPR) repeat protein
MIRKFVTVLGLACVVLATSSCQKLQARDHLNKGIKAFREAKFENAVDHFQKASELDPELLNAELYLATAYAQQYIPNGPSDENLKFAQSAIQTYEKVLAKDPQNVNAVQGLAGMYQNLQEIPKAREYYKKQTEIEPDNPIPYYALGSTAWILVANKNEPLPDEQKAPLIEEGLQYLDRALEKDPRYSEAMAYKNLLLRQKALVTKDPAQAKLLEAEADEWYNKTLEARATASEKKAEAE